MSAPHRVQLSRKKGWRKPENTVVVARGTVWGNPFRVTEHCRGADWGVEDTGRFNLPLGNGWTKAGAARFAVQCYQQAFDQAFPEGSTARWAMLQPLRGKNLACWCPLDQPCHADVLLELANQKDDA
ncbi:MULTISPECIES: DUF4326 domain-containing protein [unclassified Microbacterium]|uniref:DUF4326 domain-containing protein n=1 Tax=Microbacterium TaxID=33882 RepID=UPI003BA32E08